MSKAAANAKSRSPFFGTPTIDFYDAGNTVWHSGIGMWLRPQSYGNELWSFYDLYIKVFTGRTVFFLSDSSSSGNVAFNVAGVGFFGVTPTGRKTISSSRSVQTSGLIPALSDLLTALDQFGLIINQSTF